METSQKALMCYNYYY